VTSSQENKNESKVRPDYRHAYPLAIIVVVMVTAALIVRACFVPETFGDFGHYRANSIDEEASRLPRHGGRAACTECHDDVAAIHAKDAHSTIECETCHGVGGAHIEDPDVAMLRADAKADCLVCHRVLNARPGSFPQVEWQKHYQFVGVEDPDIACVRCHSGHEPLFMDRDLHKARLHPLVHDCGECHVGRSDRTMTKPEDHPTIFQCDSCHAALVTSFNQGSHTKLQCKTCHLFIKENAFSGRIVRNADPRFCLLCHRETDFKSVSGPPTIEWPSHLEDVTDGPEDTRRSCVSCHQDKIHDLYPKEKPHAL
jgi:hypothetical protein